jgi:ureidoacrylate peracid hydrolase
LSGRELRVHAAQTALLVIDMQNDFCAEGGFLQKEKGYDVGFAKAVVANIRMAVAAARHAGTSVVWIRSVYDFRYLCAAHIAKRGREGCCMEGTWGADFFELSAEPQDPIVEKHTFSGFHDTPLHELLRERNVETLIIAGVATNVCVDSTLREGFFKGYHIVLLEDCVGSNSRTGHEGTLATVRNNIGTVVSTAEFIRALTGHQRTD